jgi:acetolactate synthase-1/2/3 large subunit
MLDASQGFEPRMSSKRLEDGTIFTPPLEDMFPFLERDELARNIVGEE